ncbi:tape measure protein [Ostreibacterium oceani]|uniref:Tape measure protein N-terminal domain-containing protein n=1 Tax=Ostreibacterium oceani TaxID=2654998 RepID=A0A6N7EY78_9GAMM|nr:tape measure protein [Ostreibacterium oceani]MPV86903.1 hypothetical protein [Ostreibacterium oceani]
MANSLKLQILLQTLDRASAPLNKINSAVAKTSTAFASAQKRVHELSVAQKKLGQFNALRKSTLGTKQSLNSATAELKSLARAMALTENPSKQLQQKFKRQTKQVKTLSGQYNKQKSRLSRLKGEMKNAGVNTKRLGDYQKKLAKDITSANHAMGKQRKAAERMARLKNMGGNLRATTLKYARRGAVAGSVATGVGAMFGRGLINTASEFERYEAILKTVEGTSAKAAKSMDWVSDFTAKTPYELAEVTDAFVKLRAYGLDPQTGLLKTLGDTAAAMGKPLNQAVEAIADAVTGENERLKEFGIKANSKGEEVTYNYTDKAGIQRFKTVMKNDRAAIEAALTEIWNEKYEGAADELAKTWVGIISNLKDQWARFQLSIMRSGAFDLLKQKLLGLLDKINAMAKNGELKALAEKIGGQIVSLVKGVSTLFRKISEGWGTLTQLTDKFGGMAQSAKLLGISFGSIKLASFFGIGKGLAAIIKSKGALAVLGKFAFGLKAVGLAIFASPIGWLVLAVGALAGAAYLLYKNWDKVTQWFSTNPFALAIQNMPIVRQLIDGLSYAIEFVVAILNGDWAGAWEAAKSFAKAALDFVTTPIRKLWELIEKIGNYVGIDIGAHFERFKEVAASVVNFLHDKFGGVLKLIEKVINGFKTITGMQDKSQQPLAYNNPAAGIAGGIAGQASLIKGGVKLFQTYASDDVKAMMNPKKIAQTINNNKTVSAPITQNITINEASNPRAVANAVAAKTNEALIGDN